MANTDADVHILVIVDTAATIQNYESGNFEPVIYMVDDDPTPDSNQGTVNLITNVAPEGLVTWKPSSINNDDEVELASFDDSKGCQDFFKDLPTQDRGSKSWTGEVAELDAGTSASYGFYFKINGNSKCNGEKFYFDPELRMRLPD
ncbi:hypothetical protein LVD15_14420 [Fulvivirga maritima]|uniref:hypothetical protein n=1 Tax=Fulvivirga maritima TaxID=2904247 RepID=UPI001F2EF2CC|nr:hypothetical protein [Fulvivirga maritima]UII24518.1 hypothetical protein LVD15_14420 [Fulvivirga maritima]